MKYHEGAIADSALGLMRSRYSAYAIGLTDYIIQTTSVEKQRDLIHKREELLAFAKGTSFDGLEILDIEEGDPISYVTFVAILHQGDVDVSFTEKSRFEKAFGKWYYHSGDVSFGQN
jgi:SEC-C motif domain protein